MRVEIWSDVVCPWCYIGKRQFEAALRRFDHADQVTVEWRSFELDPGAPRRRDMSTGELLQRKYGMTAVEASDANRRMTSLAAGVGLDYHLDRAQPGSTFDAHRLIHLAQAHGVGDAMKERLLAAYFIEGRPIGEEEALADLAAEVGLDPAAVASTLHGDGFADEVRRDEERAVALGISGVPFFVIDGSVGVGGAQPAEVLLRALERAWSASHPVTVIDGTEGGSAGTCGEGTCAV